MPFREDLDVRPLLAKLGVPDHGLRPSMVRLPGVDSSDPFPAGDGPLYASTSMALQPYPEIIWDVNGYLRMFGLTFPYRPLSKKVLREAALALGHTQTRLGTYVLQLLLHDSPERREYLSRRLGQTYLDRFTLDKLWGMAAEMAGLMTRASGEEVTRVQVMKSWGLEALQDGPAEGTEKDPEDADGATLSEVSGTERWDWSFYVQKRPKVDLDRLRDWQQMLVSVLNHLRAERDVKRIAVGIAADQDWRWDVQTIDGELLFLLGNGIDPTIDDALDAAWYAVTDQGLSAIQEAQRGHP